MKYETKMILLITGLWIIFYLIFDRILSFFTESTAIKIISFLIFVAINYFIFPAAYFYGDRGILINLPIDFFVSLTGGDIFFSTFMFITLGPFALYINSIYLYNLIQSF